MTNYVYFLPADAFCIEISGKDAAKVANNLNTNDIAKLDEGNGLESFVTNVRGWVVAHVVVVRQPDKILLVGRHSRPEDICNHIDRYIIREDAQVRLRTDVKVVCVLDPTGQWLESRFPGTGKEKPGGSVVELTLGSYQGWALDAPFSGCEELLLLVDVPADRLGTTLEDVELSEGNLELLELFRIKQRWPLQGTEIADKTIPQELDRDGRAISFTKGCYLGQETVARLDARGQLQKKLSLIEFALTEGLAPAIGDRIFCEEKEVGTLTSFAADGRRGYGLAMLKRGAFDAGTTLQLIDPTMAGLEAKVVEPHGR